MIEMTPYYLVLFFRAIINTIIVASSLYISIRANNLHVLSSYKGFKIFRNTFLFYAIAFYVTHLIAPTGLSAFHPYPLDGLSVEYYIAPLVTIMLVFLLFRLKGQQRRFFGRYWYSNRFKTKYKKNISGKKHY